MKLKLNSKKIHSHSSELGSIFIRFDYGCYFLSSSSCKLNFYFSSLMLKCFKQPFVVVTNKFYPNKSIPVIFSLYSKWLLSRLSVLSLVNKNISPCLSISKRSSPTKVPNMIESYCCFCYCTFLMLYLALKSMSADRIYSF